MPIAAVLSWSRSDILLTAALRSPAYRKTDPALASQRGAIETLVAAIHERCRSRYTTFIKLLVHRKHALDPDLISTPQVTVAGSSSHS